MVAQYFSSAALAVRLEMQLCLEKFFTELSTATLSPSVAPGQGAELYLGIPVEIAAAG